MYDDDWEDFSYEGDFTTEVIIKPKVTSFRRWRSCKRFYRCWKLMMLFSNILGMKPGEKIFSSILGQLKELLDCFNGTVGFRHEH